MTPLILTCHYHLTIVKEPTNSIPVPCLVSDPTTIALESRPKKKLSLGILFHLIALSESLEEDARELSSSN
jgi:hypothetical protein